MSLRIAQAILAVAIALSVATLPATTGFAAVASSMTDMSVSGDMPDCDQHSRAAPANKSQKTADDCMAACALLCFNFTATDFSGVAFSSPASAALKSFRMNGHVSSLMGNPPFRPPRI